MSLLEQQALLYVPRSATSSGPVSYRTWKAALRADPFGAKQLVSEPLALTINVAAHTTYTGGTSSSAPQPGTVEAFEVAQEAAALASVAVNDDKFVSAWMASLLPDAQVESLGGTMGLNGPVGFIRAALADLFIVVAKAKGRTVRQLVSELGQVAPGQDDDVLPQRDGLGGPQEQFGVVQGSGSIFGELGKKIGGAIDKAEVILRAVQTGVGVGLQQMGRAVLILGDRQPWFNQFVSKPLGFHLLSTAISEVGNAIVDGSIKTIDGKKLTRSAGSWFTAVGTALAAAAPFTGPWAPLFSACAAVNIAIGKTINGMLDRSEYTAAQRAGLLDVERRYDASGREVDSRGVPVDPIARQAWAREQQAKAQEGESQGGQALGSVKRGPDGWFYGPKLYPSGKSFMTAYEEVPGVGKQPSRLVARFGWDGTKWRKVAA